MAVILVSDFWSILRAKEFFMAQKVMAVIFLLVFIGEILYSINTNLTKQPFGPPDLCYFSARSYNYGFNQLEKYFQQNIFSDFHGRRIHLKL